MIEKRLRKACISSHADPELIKQLVAEGVDVNAVEQGSTPLRLAIHIGRPENVQALVEAGANPSEALSYAIYCRNWEALDILIRGGADLTSTDENGQNALHIASKQSYDDMVGTLLEAGLSPDIPDSDGNVPLHLASRRRPLQMGDINISLDESPEVEDGDFQRNVVDLLLSYGASPNIQNNDGNTPLHFYIQNKLYRPTILLFAAGGDFNIANHEGVTSLALVDQDDKPYVRFVNFIMREKEYPLHLVAQTGGYANFLSKLCAQKKQDVNSMSFFGRTPLSYAAQYSSSIYPMRVLIEAGADVNLLDTGGEEPPISYAATNGHSEQVRMLLDHGASRTWCGTDGIEHSLEESYNLGRTKKRRK